MSDSRHIRVHQINVKHGSQSQVRSHISRDCNGFKKTVRTPWYSLRLWLECRIRPSTVLHGREKYGGLQLEHAWAILRRRCASRLQRPAGHAERSEVRGLCGLLERTWSTGGRPIRSPKGEKGDKGSRECEDEQMDHGARDFVRSRLLVSILWR